MKVSAKKSAIACTAAAVMLSGMGFTSIAANAATAITTSATLSQPNQPVPGLSGWPYSANLFYPDESPDSLITDLKVVNYDASLFFMNRSMKQGAEKGAEIVLNTEGKIVKVGLSQGAGADEMMISILMSDPNRPEADDLKFVMIGSPYAENGIGRQDAGKFNLLLGGNFLSEVPDSDWDILYVSKEGDLVADRPENLNFFSALIGFFEHIDYSEVDMTRKDILIKVDGNRTYAIIPQGDLALLKPLRVLAEAVDRTFGTTVAVGAVDNLQSLLKQLANPVYNREGYVRVDEYVPPAPKAVTEFVSDVPDSVSPQGDSPAATQSRFVSLDVSSETVPPAASGGTEGVTPLPVTEEVVVDEEVQSPVVTPEPDTTPVVTPEPVVEQKPQPSTTPAVSNDKKDTTEANDDKDDDTKDEKKVERKKPGSNLNQSVARSHRGAMANDDNDDDKPSASASSTSSPSSNSNSTSNSTNSGSANAGGAGGNDE